MDRYGNVESESPVIQHVDREEQRRADAPFSKWHRRRPEEITTVGVKLVV